jgi:dTDP-4-dehydrorhamnose reductase
MRIVVLGASGMLGQALMAEGQARGHNMIGNRVDVTDSTALILHLFVSEPDLIINSAAMTDLAACEADREQAHAVNSQPVLAVRRYIEMTTRPVQMVQISSDQAESRLNVYAESKWLGELMMGGQGLIIRTNIVGLRGHGKPTFAEWAMDAIAEDAPMTLFDDYFSSSVDIWNFSQILFELLEARPDIRGLLNIASRTVSSKKEFIEALAAQMGKVLTRATVGSVDGLFPARPKNCGLDVEIIEMLLGREMPDLEQVVSSLEKNFRHTFQSTGL